MKACNAPGLHAVGCGRTQTERISAGRMRCSSPGHRWNTVFSQSVCRHHLASHVPIATLAPFLRLDCGRYGVLASIRMTSGKTHFGLKTARNPPTGTTALCESDHSGTDRDQPRTATQSGPGQPRHQKKTPGIAEGLNAVAVIAGACSGRKSRERMLSSDAMGYC